MFSEENKARSYLFSTLYGIGSALLISLVMLLTASLVMTLSTDPKGSYYVIGIAILYISCFFGGFITKLSSDSLLPSIFSGMIMSVTILLLSMTQKGASALTPAVTIAAYLAVIASCFAGGLIHTAITSKRPKRRISAKRKR